MATHLQFLPLEEADEGMVLGAPLVLTEHGVMTYRLPAGHRLTESNLRQLAVHHGEFVCVEVEDLRNEAERQNQWLQHEKRLAHLFRRADLSNLALAALYQAVTRFRRM